MSLDLKTYRNSTELGNLNGVPIYMADMVDAALRGRLNIFLQGDTGSGKTQLAADVMDYFGEKSLFILGRNDMDTRELFQQVNPEYLRAIREGTNTNANFKELTDKIDYHLIVVDELPNCVPAVRAQLFNLFDGFIEIDGKRYPIGSNYSIGIATGNIGQQFTESSNEMGRALKDRMHLNIDTDFFRPKPIDTFDILISSRDPRVKFSDNLEDRCEDIIQKHDKLKTEKVPLEKYIIAGYLVHGLDILSDGRSKTKMKGNWQNKLTSHQLGSDEALIYPCTMRATDSIITLSQALDQITRERGAEETDYFESMMLAYKFISANSGVLTEATVRETYDGNPYDAMDAVIHTTRTQFSDKRREQISAGIGMVQKGDKDERILSKFSDRWSFMKDLLENLADREKMNLTQEMDKE